MARKILLADDSVTAQNMGRKILTDAGYEVMTVNNGSAALKRVTEQKPDLIVLDIYMPGYSGLEVCQRLKDSRDTARIPILLTVGKLEPFKPEDARRVAADAFIVKPFEASELLSALTRLEDRIVPQGDGSRFATSVSGIERFAAERRPQPADAGEQGWKSRIRFPSKKPKTEEPEPEPDFVTPPSFRDFRGGAAKTAAAATTPAETPRQEPGLVPDIPHDITPAELDALSALVAKLDGPIPQAEEIAPIGDKIGPNETPSELKAEIAAAEISDAAEAVPPAVEPAAHQEEVAQNAEAITTAEAKTESVAEAAAPAEIETVAPPADYTPAPIDRDDEPIFASVQSAEAQGGQEGETPSSAPNEALEAPPAEAKLPDQVPAPAEEKQPPPAEEVEKQKDRSRVEEIVAEAVAEEAVAEQPSAGEDRVPTDEELAEALRLLTPVHEVQGAGSPEQKESALATGDSIQHKVATTSAGNGSRWLAEAVELSPEEASISLESEMFRILAPISVPAPVVAVEAAVPQATAAGQTEVANVPEAQVPSEPAAPEVNMAPGDQSEVKEPPAAEAEQTPASEGVSEEPASATFASQYAADVSESTGSARLADETVQEQVNAASAALSDEQEVTGDEESMARHVKTDQGKGAKSGWHQIHAAVPTSKTDVESAKHSEAEPQSEDSPKAMAAAASDDAASTAAPDPNAIASIVDSVLADLRPRIVEEIAKKLAKK